MKLEITGDEFDQLVASHIESARCLISIDAVLGTGSDRQMLHANLGQALDHCARAQFLLGRNKSAGEPK